MKPFRHVNARTVEEAVARLAGYKNAKIIAGGTDCLAVLKNRVLSVYPETLVNIKTIPDLASITEDASGLRIGALTRLSDLAESPLIREKYGVLAEAASSVGSLQLRNMGTLGGNLCQDVRCWYYRMSPLTGRAYNCLRKGGRECYAVKGDNRYHAVLGGKGCFAVCPSDTAIALTALDAEIEVKGPRGEKTIAVRDFYKVLRNVLKPTEVVTEIRVPAVGASSKQTFLKFRLRKALDFAIVSVASVATIEDGVCKDIRIALGGVAPTPVRARKVEEAMRGKAITRATAEAAAAAAVAGAVPLSMNAYKVEIAKALVKRAILT